MSQPIVFNVLDPAFIQYTLLALAGWALLAAAVAAKMGTFLREDDYLFGYVVPKHYRRV